MLDKTNMDHSLYRLGSDPLNLPQLLAGFFEAFQTALTAARWLIKPQMRVLYGVTLMITVR